jgi:uncharacterized membrane protein YebE (DUF533 family)
MSLGSTLLKVAIGIALAKGVSTLSKKGLGSGQASAPGTGTRYGGEKSTGLEDVFSDAIGKKTAQPTPQAGTGNSIDDFLGNLTGNSGQTPRTTTRANAPTGGLEDILGGLLGGKMAGGTATGGSSGGSIGDLLGGLLGAKPEGQTLPEPGSIGGGAASNDAMAQGRAKGPMRSTTRHEDLAAALILRAMVQAAKADGDLDAGEKTQLFKNMGDASPDEVAFVKAELARPVDIDGLARQVPNGMEEQVYAMSLMAINLDNQAEAQYLHKLATALELDQNAVNALHDKAGAQRLYR